MTNALWITLIGMSLVFVAILLLWGMMALLVRLTSSPEKMDAPPLEASAGLNVEAGSSAIPDGSLALERKRRAAVAAVAVAMARQRADDTSQKTVTPVVSVSAWQAVHRAGQLSRQSNGPSKKVVR
jgi:Na+-transporting methylmalonyl-CoA/oxaloacetate decarboxylase gamma subunit